MNETDQNAGIGDYQNLRAIRTSELISQGYTEDGIAEAMLDRKISRNTKPLLGAAVIMLIIVPFVLVLPSLGGGRLSPISMICGFICVFAFFKVSAIAYRRPVLSRHNGKPMIKYRNLTPGMTVQVGTIYVCPESKTFFTRIWRQVGGEG
jgi:hypothetical protein